MPVILHIVPTAASGSLWQSNATAASYNNNNNNYSSAVRTLWQGFSSAGAPSMLLPAIKRRAFSSQVSCRAGGGEGMMRDVGELLVGEYGARIVLPCYEQGEQEELGDIKLDCDDSGCVILMPRAKSLAEDDTGGFLRCDLTGCYFSNNPPSENNFEVVKGQGWCLGYETAPDSEDSFSAVVGAGGWSIALTASEFNDFTHLVQTLRKGISTMDEDGHIGKDDITLQVERGNLWMECSIPKKRVAILQSLWKLGNPENQQASGFELRFVLSDTGRRQVEGCWPAEAVMEMLKRIDDIKSGKGGSIRSQKIWVPAAS